MNPFESLVVNDIEKNNQLIEKLAEFNTDGYDKYPIEEFRRYISENSIDVGKCLDIYLNCISKTYEDFSMAEMSFHGAFRAWLQCEHEKAMEYVTKKFNFDCDSDDEFNIKYKFFNVVALLFFENMSNSGESLEINNEVEVFSKLKDGLSKDRGSFLLNYLASDYEQVLSGKENSVQKHEDMEYYPFKVSPGRYGFDKRSFFVMASKNGLAQDTFFISEPADMVIIEKIIESSKNSDNKLISQEDFDRLITYFRPMKQEDISVKRKSDDQEKINIFLFRKLHEKYNRSKISKITGVDLSGIPLIEQNIFINYLKFADRKKVDQIKDFTSKYKLNGYKTFISVEHGGKQMGDKILTLGEKLPEDAAKILFKTYSEMVDASEEVGTLLAENLGEKSTPELIEKAKDSLLLAGKNLLEKYADKVATCEDQESENLGTELVERLSLAKKSVFAFSYACKTLVESDQFSLEDFNKAKLVYDKSPVPEEMQKQIIAMHNENTKQYPEKLKVVWRQTLKDGLEIENPDQMVASVVYEDDVVATMRVIKQQDGSWYGASFNVNPTVQGSKIGTELLKKVIEDLAKDKPFVADCYSENPMLKTYLDKFGFKITKEIPNYHDTESLVYQITLFPKES